MTFTTRTIHSFNDFNLPVEPTGDLVLTNEKNGRTFVGYLTDDRDSQNPLEDSDTYGSIYTAHRHAGREVHRNMQQALGLAEDWEADPGIFPVKHHVVLDCYEHSGIAYSVQGQGTQCRFDTAKGAAVWVPNDICLEEIHRRAAVYRKGRIIKLKQHWFVEEYGSLIEKLPQFKTWGEAFNYLESVGVIDCHLKYQEHAEAMAAQELALQAVEVYNAYLNGDVYGVVIAQYDSETKELIEYDDCYGFFGYDYAKEELNERINQNDPI